MLTSLTKKSLCETIIFYFLTLLVFHFTQNGVPLSTYGIIAYQILLPIAGIYFMQQVTRQSLFSFTWLSSFCLGIAYFALLPFIQRFDPSNPYQWNPRRDMLFGLYLFLFLMVLQTSLALLQKKVPAWVYKLGIVLYTIFSLILCIVPIVQTAHFILYHVPLSQNSVYAIQTSYFQEALGYIKTYIPPVVLILIALSIIVTAIFIYKICRKMSPSVSIKSSIIILLLLPVLLVYLLHAKDKTAFCELWTEVVNYRQEQNLFTKNYLQRYQNLQLTSSNTLAQSNPGTVIVVLGESASRNYMKIYTPAFLYNDTPWLESKRNDPNFIIYNNVYTSWNQTVESLSRACTEMSQYNDKPFNQSITMIDIAKKAGYHTYWFTRQGGMGQYDAPITLIMKTVDHYESPTTTDTLQYDDDLLPFLKKINPQQNNFIVLHLQGSHVPYQNDYPKEDTIFDPSTKEGNYANTILYTDKVLKDIFTYAQQNLNLKVMLYFSDHGENPEHGHGPNVRTFDTLRIPMFLYLSPDYQQTYMNKFNLLQSRKDTYFTNDMIYNTLSGIVNAPSNHYDAKEDLSSPSYNFTRDTLWTFLHTVPISADPT